MSAEDIRDQAKELHGIADQKGHGGSDIESHDGQNGIEQDEAKANGEADGARDVRQSIREAYRE